MMISDHIWHKRNIYKLCFILVNMAKSGQKKSKDNHLGQHLAINCPKCGTIFNSKISYLHHPCEFRKQLRKASNDTGAFFVNGTFNELNFQGKEIIH